MAGYGALSEVYEWLVGDDRLAPEQAVTAYCGDVLASLPPGARVLDCACGTGQLAVGLAGLGLDVVASDASEGMVRRTAESAVGHDVALRTLRASWDELPDHLEDASFDLVACVGNSLGHAEGPAGRRRALAAMSRLLAPGGRLVLHSRNWELVRAAGSRIDVRDRLVRRGDRDAVVTYHWQVAPEWDDEHLLEIVVAQLEPGGGVRACSERLSLWPYRYDDLVAELRAVGLAVDESTHDPATDGYQLVASHEPGWTPLAVRGTSR